MLVGGSPLTVRPAPCNTSLGRQLSAVMMMLESPCSIDLSMVTTIVNRWYIVMFIISLLKVVSEFQMCITISSSRAGELIVWHQPGVVMSIL